MNRLFSILTACLIALSMNALISDAAYSTWHASKFSMFIHFGLYSELGGVWNGEPVKYGYSEQIQSFAGIFSDWYGETANYFNPTAFDADSIVALAKEAGMRSIVITTKHHDGFCMFRTATTDYNSYDATPAHRDYVGELAEACRRGGIRLGLYYSIIDWHYPHAYPISSHNCDFITPQHHEFSKRQVTELLTNYGPISELWFDMGSNTPQQSKELYDLVHRLQPDCMVSGRVGNDQYDFAVMADNAYPEGALQCPWQSAASMFNETWGYRSWQERGDAHTKAMEKLRSLINVVSHGGNFLLNIGPKGDGSVVPFESEVLREIGAWLHTNGEAIYSTEASPFRETFDWGAITRKDNRLYLILSGKLPDNGQIALDMPGYRLTGVSGCATAHRQKGSTVSVTVPSTAYNDSTIEVVTLEFDRTVEPQPTATLPKGSLLTSANATPNYSYSCFDYYSNYRSTVSYSWNVKQNRLRQVEITYTPQEAGATVNLTIDGTTYPVTLDKGTPVALSTSEPTWGTRYVCGPGSGVFNAASTLRTDPEHPLTRRGKWEPTDKEQDELPSGILSSHFVMQEFDSPCRQYYLMDVGAGNGIEVYLNGHSVMKHLNPYRCTFRPEKVLLPLEKGKNQIVLRLYNRFEKTNAYQLRPAADQTVYRQTFTLPAPAEGNVHSVTVRREGLASQHTDTELSNLQLRLR